MIDKVKKFWASLPDSVKRQVHTFWQAFLAVLLAGIFTVHSFEAATALLVAALAAGLSAVKAFYTAKK